MRFLLVLVVTLSALLALGAGCGGDEKAAPMLPSPASGSDGEAEEAEGWEADDLETEDVGEADVEPEAAAEGEQPLVSATLDVTPRDYVGPCPVTLTLSGTITLEAGSGTVSYQFVDSGTHRDHVISEDTLTFDSPGTQNVSTTLNRGTPGSVLSFSDWVLIRILEPQELESNRANYSIDCDEGGLEEDCLDADMDGVCDDDDNDDDNDGFSDADENDYGSDPLDDASVPETEDINPDSCIDDVDNDGDGLTDGVDPGCP